MKTLITKIWLRENEKIVIEPTNLKGQYAIYVGGFDDEFEDINLEIKRKH